MWWNDSYHFAFKGAKCASFTVACDFRLTRNEELLMCAWEPNMLGFESSRELLEGFDNVM